LIISVSLPAIPQGIASVTFLGVIRDSIEPSRMTRLLSVRQLALNLTIAFAALTFGVWLEQAPFPLNYQIMFLLAFAFSLVSLWHCTHIRVDVPAAVPVASTPLTSIWRSRSFQRFAVIAAVVHIAFFTIVPVTPLFLVNRLGADEGYMALFALLELGAGAAASILAPRLNERIGTRPMIALAMVGTAVAALVIALSTNLYVPLIAAVISGACWTAGAGVGLFRLFVDNAPEGEMTGYSTAYNQVVGLSVFIGPMFGSMMANNGVNLILVMAFGAVLRVLAAPLIDSSHFMPQRTQSARAAASRALMRLRAASHIAT
jgi:MFS family permease